MTDIISNLPDEPAAVAVDPSDKAWDDIRKMIEFSKQHTFHVGDVFMSPGWYRFEVVHVSTDGVATLHKQGSGWHREVRMAWNSPKLDRWTRLERKS